ncbi:MAG: hypothetical protein EXR71_10765 [Myxococcales bacterium]|nr:hypothetical protein [Myxococcales bacterium]
MASLWSLLACVGDPKLAISTEGCQNVDPDDPADPVVATAIEGDTVDVYRTPVVGHNLEDVFEPTITTDGDLVEIFESWTAGEEATPACLEPHLAVSEFGATIEIRWYTEDDATVPFDTVKIDPP